MTVKVTIYDRSANDIMDIVRELRTQGLKQGEDFDFKYQPPVWDNFAQEPQIRKQCQFTFYSEKFASFFAIKYGSPST